MLLHSETISEGNQSLLMQTSHLTKSFLNVLHPKKKKNLCKLCKVLHFHSKQASHQFAVLSFTQSSSKLCKTTNRLFDLNEMFLFLKPYKQSKGFLLLYLVKILCIIIICDISLQYGLSVILKTLLILKTNAIKALKVQFSAFIEILVIFYEVNWLTIFYCEVFLM